MLFEHSQANKYVLRLSLNLYTIWIFYWLPACLPARSPSRPPTCLPALLMLSEKHNSIITKVMYLISSLFNISWSSSIPFCQSQQIQCLHHESSNTYLCSSLCLILFFIGHKLQSVHYGFSLKLGKCMTNRALLTLFFDWKVVKVYM